MSILYCENISKNFDDGGKNIEVLKDINLSIESGEQIAIVGSSGSGKTTLLHIMSGLDKPTSGSIKFNDNCLASMSEKQKSKLRNHELGFIYQFHHLLPEFTALENVAMPLLISGLNSKIALERAENYLERVGLKERLTHKPSALSGGERQRVAIARALVSEPKCVFADEPTGNLDNRTATEIYQLILSLNEEFNMTFVIVTHDEVLAGKLDRMYHLNQGELVK